MARFNKCHIFSGACFLLFIHISLVYGQSDQPVQTSLPSATFTSIVPSPETPVGQANATVPVILSTTLGDTAPLGAGTGNRTIWLQNNNKVDLPITIDVVTGIRCIDGDPQCPYEGGIGSGAHELIALPVLMEDVQKKPEWAMFFDMNLRISDFNGAEWNSIEAVANATFDTISLAIIGPQDTCVYEPGIAAVDNRFILSYRCGGRQQTDTSTPSWSPSTTTQSTTDYSSFAQLRSAFGDVSKAVVDFMKSYDWERAVILHFTDNSPESLTNLDTLSKSMAASEIAVVKVFAIDNRLMENVIPTSSVARSKYLQILTSTYMDTRAYVIMSTTPGAPEAVFFTDIMSRMSLLQTGEYVVLVTEPPKYDYLYDGSPNTADVWLKYPLNPYKPYGFPLFMHPTPEDIFNFYRSAAFVIESWPVISSPKWQNFQTRVRAVMKNPPCPLLCNLTIVPFPPPYPDEYISMETGLLYDSVMSFLNATYEMVASNVSDPHKGDVMVQQYGERVINSVTGMDLFVDSFGVPKGNISILAAIQPDKSLKLGLYPSAQFWLNVTENTVGWIVHYHNAQKMNWLNAEPPPSRPKCNWKGEGCPSWKDNILPIVGRCAAIIAIVAVVTFIMFFRPWRYVHQKQSSFWRILSEDLNLKNLQERMASMKSVGSATMESLRSQVTLMKKSDISLGDSERTLLEDIRQHKKEVQQKTKKKRGLAALKLEMLDQEEKRPTLSEEERNKAWNEFGHFGVAEFNDHLVALKKLYKPKIEFSKAICEELKLMIETRNNNINSLEGLIYEPPLIYMVSEFRQRGCLKDILENEAIEIDRLFLASMVNDLIKGVQFLHHSQIGVHGKLRSTNCLLDTRWVLRLSGFDLTCLRENETRVVGEEEHYKKLVWTAPELLRCTVARIKGTQKGDIYSLGIILHEIFGRKGPFGNDTGPSEIVNRVTNLNPGDQPFRPDMSILKNAPNYLQLLMRACWEELPEIRPTIDRVKRRLHPMINRLNSNVFDNMISMMERYSTNLENILTDRTDQLIKEKLRTERLLLQIVPRTIAETLKQGQSIDPESSSIYVFDIAGFESTPQQFLITESKDKDTLAGPSTRQTRQYRQFSVDLSIHFEGAVESVIGIQQRIVRISEEEKLKNREILTKIIECLIFLGRHNIVLRGHSEDGPIFDTSEFKDGNLGGLLKFRAHVTGDEVLRHHLETKKGTASYITPEIQKQLLAICGRFIQCSIVERANRSKAFSILVDEVADVSNKEILSISIRFVENDTSKLFEYFLGFVDLSRTTTEEISNSLLSFLKEIGLDLSFWRGQGFDGASSMAGRLSKVQIRIKELSPKAELVHCAKHNLNLVLNDASNVDAVANAMQLVKQITTFIHNSPKRTTMLEEAKAKLGGLSGDEFQNKLIKLCTTKWTERQHSVQRFWEQMPVVIFFLQELSKDQDVAAKDRSRLKNMLRNLLQFEVIFTISMLNTLSPMFVIVSEKLQSTSVDLIGCHEYIQQCVERLTAQQESRQAFERIYGDAVTMSQQIGLLDKDLTPKDLLTSIPIGQEKYSTPGRHYPVYASYVKEAVSYLEARFSNITKLIFYAQRLIPAYFNDDMAVIEALYKYYSPDLCECSEADFLDQYRCWKFQFRNSEEKPKTALEAMASCSEFQPAIKRVLQILATLPVSTATPERSFSTFPILETYLRSTMGDERTTSLALMHIHRSIDIDVAQILSEFRQRSCRTDL